MKLGLYSVAVQLLKAGANADALDDKGKTLMHLIDVTHTRTFAICLLKSHVRAGGSEVSALRDLFDFRSKQLGNVRCAGSGGRNPF